MAARNTKPQKFARIQALGKEKVDALNNMLARGTSAMAVARHIQKVWKQFEDVSEKSLTQQINRYKMEVVVSEVTVEEEAQPKDSPKRLTLRGQLNTLLELENLAQMQMWRLKIAYDREKTMKMLLKGTGMEVVILRELLEKIQKMRFDLGLDEFAGPVMGSSRTQVTKLETPTGTLTVGVKEEVFGEAAQILQRFEADQAARVIEHDPRTV